MPHLSDCALRKNPDACERLFNPGKPILEMLLGRCQRFIRCLRPGRDEGRAAHEVIERNGFPDDV